ALSARVVLEADGSVGDATWDFNVKKQLLTIKTATEDINNLIIFAGHDWENETETILFTGLDAQGHSVWGKRIN
ncbi:arabinan endo-1,5-alpha-L-arabinosidase, partial [Phocaeicola vulgatus]